MINRVPIIQDKHTSRKTTRLTSEELQKFQLIKMWMTGYCGEVSDAEVLRYLVREWSETDQLVGR